MNTKTKPARVPGYNPIELLDGSTRLRMARTEESRPVSGPAHAAAIGNESSKAGMTKEAFAAGALLFGFTALFWVLLGLIRTH